MMKNKPALLVLLLCILLSACSAKQPAAHIPTIVTAATTPGSASAVATNTVASPPRPTDTPLPPTATPTPPTATTAPSSTPTHTPAPTETLTATPAPTYVKLRGEVIVDQAVCHYGPGAPYLYKYGVYKGSNLEIIARVEPGDYVEVQAIGGSNPCWVNPKYLKIKGDLSSLQPIRPEDVHLPMSPYYAPPTHYSARRDGNTVTVFWSQLVLRAGDDSEQMPYVIEAWVCHNGQIVFAPTGTHELALKFEDEPGCAAPSHARLIAAEKHGYTRPVDITWPPAQ